MPTAEQKIEKLQTLLKMLDESITKEEFVTSFEKIAQLVLRVEQDLVKKIDAKTEQAKTSLDKLKQDFQDVIERVKADSEQLKVDNESTFGAFKWRTLEYINSLFIKNKVNVQLTVLLEKYRERIDSFDKQTQEAEARIKTIPDTDQLIEKALAKIPPYEKLKPIEIRNNLETLKDKERLDISAIRGFEEQIKKLEERIAQIPRGGRIGMRKIPIIRRQRLTDQVNGNTRAFNLPIDTVDVLGLWGTSFPITFDSSDWTFSGRTLTLASSIPTPAKGQTLMAIIETLFY